MTAFGLAIHFALVLPALPGDERHLFTQGGQAGERFGARVAAAGDVDADGLDDWMVGAPAAVGFAGAVRVYSGATGARLHEFVGSGFSRLGEGLAGGHDWNGDGHADVAVGAPFGGSGEGLVELRSGAGGGLLATWSGESVGDEFGGALAVSPDSDGDGTPDLWVGASRSDAAGANAGRVYQWSGATGTLAWTHDGAGFDLFGSALAAVGDLDGDGSWDVAVGAPLADDASFNSGAVRVLSGIDGRVVSQSSGTAVGDLFGSDVAACGDVDGDGVSDVLVGAPLSDAGGFDSGAAEVRSGVDGGLLLRIAGDSVGQLAGSVAGVGDVDLDGVPDVALGASSAASEAGLLRIVSGATGAELFRLVGDAPDDWFGASLADVGDLNGDGVRDLAVGAPVHDDELAPAGYARAFSTRPLSLASDRHEVSLAGGGAQALELCAPPGSAGLPYFLLGSTAGTQPGIALAPGLVLPLAFDPVYTLHTLQNPNAFPLSGSLGVFDATGRATASVEFPAGSPAAWGGLVLFHAWVGFNAAGAPTTVSVPAPLLLLP